MTQNTGISLRSRVGRVIQFIRFHLYHRERHSIPMMDWQETIDSIRDRNKSISRFGDGELLIVFEYLKLSKSNSTFQDYDSNLGKRLFEILKGGSTKQCIVGLPNCMLRGGTRGMSFGAAYFWQRFSADWIKHLLNIVPTGVENAFGDTNMTRFYADFNDKRECQDKVKALRSIWEGRNVLVVEGSQTRLGVGNDLLANAKSVRRILCPPKNAFGAYSNILDAVKNEYRTGDLIIAALGMTATVLAFDLSQIGIQACDLGHMDIEYEWMRNNSKTRTKVEGKFTNEAHDREIVLEFKDSLYQSQIVGIIASPEADLPLCGGVTNCITIYYNDYIRQNKMLGIRSARVAVIMRFQKSAWRETA